MENVPSRVRTSFDHAFLGFVLQEKKLAKEKKGDISNGNSDILNTKTVTFSSPKGDAIVSPEWVEWFHEWGFKGGR